MQFTTIVLLTACLQVSATSLFAQKVSISGKKMPLKRVFHEIKEQTGYNFVYANEDLKRASDVTLDEKNVDMREVLSLCFAHQPLTYSIYKKIIIVKPKPVSTSPDVLPVEVKGTVTDSATGKPLSGVTIRVKGGTTGATTDKNGQFTLDVPDNATLEISYLGYKQKEIAIDGRSEINIALAPSLTALNQLVVVGYGEQKKATVTGSISTINSKQITTTTNENVLNMLTGKLPGLRIVQNSSEPGSFNNKFDIRGFGSPLIVIDGVPRGNINRLDPNDIASISVLKDASAAVYGVRAANGVILITTKKGQEGTLKLSYTGTVGFQVPSGLPEDVNAAEWMTLRNEKQMHNVNGGSLAFSEEDIEQYRNGTKKSTNWFPPVINQHALQTEHYLSANGGTDKTSYYISLGYLKQDGFWKSGDLNYKKYNVRSNITSHITNRITAQLMISGIVDQKNQPYADAWTIFKNLWRQVPTGTVYANDNPLYLGNREDGKNPVAMTSSDISGYKQFNNKWFQSSFSLSYDIPFITGLRAKGFYSYDFNMSDNKYYRKAFNLYEYDGASGTYIPAVSQSPSNIYRSYSKTPSSLLQVSFDYTHSFQQVHNVSALLLYEESTNNGDNFYASRDLALEIEHLFAGNSLNQQGYMNANGLYKTTNKGLVGKFNYDYKAKYLAEFSFRYDGSSKFAPGKQWGFFPALSIGWRISEENFMKNSRQLSFIDNLKLRASYGKMGDDRASSYQFISGYTYPASGGSSQGLASGSVFDGSFVNAIGFTNLPNPDITWFTVNMLNVGADIDMWQGLLGITVDVFKRKRDGLLATARLSLPGTLGAALPQENLNSDQTSGFELSLETRNKVGRLNYSVRGNFSYTRTKWLEYDQAKAGNSYDNWRNNLNNRYNNIWWGNGYIGQYQSYKDIINNSVVVGRGVLPGDYEYEDWNGDGVIDGWDAHPIATNGIPQINYGITLSASYKGFDINALFQGTAMVYVSYPEMLSQPLMWDGNALRQFMDRWHPADPTADPYDPNIKWIPGYYAYTGSTADQNSERGVQNASYIRLKSFELGYTIPNRITSSIGIDRVRLYLDGYNLVTLTGIKYVDPEHPSDTYGYIYPLNKSFNVGLNITF